MVKRGILQFSKKPVIASTGTTAGPLEKSSNFAEHIDKFYEDERCGLKTNEQAHAKLMEDACMIALSKIDKIPSDVDFIFMGDLVNQMTPSNFCSATLGIPYVGLFSACATSVSSLLMAAVMHEAELTKCAIAGSSSHHNAIERQFRYPVEYGVQKPATAQWTVTAAGVATIMKYEENKPIIVGGTIGRTIDLKMTNPLNMGAAMAPAAADTVLRHLEGHGRTVEEYDLIMTGDLAQTGFRLYKELLTRRGLSINSNFQDAGELFYGGDPVFMAGASGSGCSAAAYFGHVYNGLLQQTYKRVLLVATGSLLSPLSYQQGDTIPCIAHAVEISMK